MPTTLRANCIIVGDASVGKSALTQVYHSDSTHFPKNYTMTVGVELLTKTVNVPDSSDIVEMFFHDSAGKEMFSDLCQQFWNHPSVVMVVYDVTNETSFYSCHKWLERVRSKKPDIPLPAVLVANKCDLEGRRTVSRKEGEDFAQDNGMAYFEVSARDMQDVDLPFIHLARSFSQLYKEKVEFFNTLV